jgi:hypothetical protein
LTDAWVRTHNPRVRTLLGRAVTAIALTPCLVLGPVMPQQHVHEPDETHAQAVAHSHLDFHQQPGGHLASTADHDAPEISADDERVVWVASAGVNQRAFHLVPNWTVVEKPLAVTPNEASATRQPDIDSSPPHGPPRPSFSLRGPPLASA